MLIHFSEAVGWQNIPLTNPSNEPAHLVLEIYRNLDARRGFLCIAVGSHFSIQLHSRKDGRVCIELLDQSTASFDTTCAPAEFGETLIRAVEELPELPAPAHAPIMLLQIRVQLLVYLR